MDAATFWVALAVVVVLLWVVGGKAAGKVGGGGGFLKVLIAAVMAVAVVGIFTGGRAHAADGPGIADTSAKTVIWSSMPTLTGSDAENAALTSAIAAGFAEIAPLAGLTVRRVNWMDMTGTETETWQWSPPSGFGDVKSEGDLQEEIGYTGVFRVVHQHAPDAPMAGAGLKQLVRRDIGRGRGLTLQAPGGRLTAADRAQLAAFKARPAVVATPTPDANADVRPAPANTASTADKAVAPRKVPAPAVIGGTEGVARKVAAGAAALVMLGLLLLSWLRKTGRTPRFLTRVRRPSKPVNAVDVPAAPAVFTARLSGGPVTTFTPPAVSTFVDTPPPPPVPVVPPVVPPVVKPATVVPPVVPPAAPVAPKVIKPGPPAAPAKKPGWSPLPMPAKTPIPVTGTVARPAVTTPTKTFIDVGGYEDVKTLLRDAVGTLINNSAAARQYGIRPSGVLLYGPPGTGKTLMAEATAGELGLNFCKVTTGNLTSQWINAGAGLVKAMADTVIQNAPCLLFIDEFDGIAPRRDGDAHHEDKKVLDELLTQIDRMREAPGVVVMCATNRIEALDPAAIRDGRMDTRIRIDLPKAEAREAILLAALGSRPVERDLVLTAVVEATVGATGAILAAIVNTAALTALKKAMPISAQYLLDAITARGGTDRPTVQGAGLDKLVLPAATLATVNQVLNLLKNPTQAKALGISVPAGAILYGPPGTGKTSLARAIAAEAGCSFYPCKGSDFLEDWHEGGHGLEQMYERARSNKPSIIFIDEIESLGQKRGEGWHGQAVRLTSLLSLLDGFESNSGVFTIGATNLVDSLDPALLRGGRLERHIEIGMPDLPGRRKLLALFTSTMPLETDVDLDTVAYLVEGWSPSTIQTVVQNAGLAALARSEVSGVPVTTVTAADFASSLEIDASDVTKPVVLAG